MGFNTVALFLNDHMHILIESPQTLAWALCHPPHSHHEIDEKSWNWQVASVAKDRGERPIHFGNGVTILPTFHADEHRWLYAGGNTLEALKFHRFGTATVTDYRPRPGGGSERIEKKAKTVTLILPDWWSK